MLRSDQRRGVQSNYGGSFQGKKNSFTANTFNQASQRAVNSHNEQNYQREKP